MGTPEIAVHSLVALAAKHEVIGLFCNEDKPYGRKQVITPPETKLAALALQIPVYQPRSLRNSFVTSVFTELNPDLIVTMAYGKKLPSTILDIPRYGAINAHASLLPAYRGASPIQHALMNREEETGVTIMKVDMQIDTGDIIISQSIPLTPESDAEEVFSLVSTISAELLLKTVEMLTNGDVVYTKQDHLNSSYAPMITKDMGKFSFFDEANRIVGLVKGLCIWPGAYFELGGKKVKVFKASYSADTGEAGTIVSLKPLTVAAIDGSVILHEVMPESSRRMTGAAYVAGLRAQKGDILL